MIRWTCYKSALLLTIVLIAQPMSLCASLVTGSDSNQDRYSLTSCAGSVTSLPVQENESDRQEELRVENNPGSAMTGISIVTLTSTSGGTCLIPESLVFDTTKVCVEWIRCSDSLFWPAPPIRSLLKVPIQG